MVKQFMHFGNKSLSFRRIVAILLISLLISTLIAPVYANELEEAEREREELEQRIEQEQEGLEVDRSREEELKEELEELDNEIRQIRGELFQLNRNIITTERHIRAAERELEDAEERLSYREELLKKRLRVMHERGNVNFIEVLLDSKSFSEFLTRFYYLQAIAESDVRLMQEVEEERDNIAEKKEELEDNKEELEELRDQVSDKEREVDGVINERSDVLDELQGEIVRTEEAIQQLEEDAEKLAEEIKELEQQQQQGGVRPEGDLLWPVDGHSYITSPFGWRSNPFSGGRQWHGGLDIGTGGRTNRIFAAEGGTVIFARYSGGYGNYIMIDHGGGMMTLYAHLSSMGVSDGQTVSRGDTIGRAGTTGASTGIHLHFEVWINGERKDPLDFL